MRRLAVSCAITLVAWTISPAARADEEPSTAPLPVVTAPADALPGPVPSTPTVPPSPEGSGATPPVDSAPPTNVEISTPPVAPPETGNAGNAPPAVATTPDDPLVADLAAMFDAVSVPERRVALSRVASRLDPRAVPALVYVARRDADATIRAAALDQLHWAVSPSLETAAIDVLRRRDERDEVRLAAARLVAKHGSDRAKDALAKVAGDLDESQLLRAGVVERLAEVDATRAAALSSRALAGDAAGRLGFTVVGGLSGGYMLGLIGSMAPSSLAIVGASVGGVGGLVLGGAAAYFYAQNSPIDLGDALLLGSVAVWSVPVGAQLGSVWYGPQARMESPGTSATMLLVHALAMVGAGFAVDRAAFTLLDVVETNLFTLGGLFITSGLLMATRPEDGRIGAVAVSSAIAATFAGGALLSPWLKLTPSIGALALVATAGGAVSGGLLGGALLPRPQGPLGEPLPDDGTRASQSAGLSFVGAGLGLAGLLAASVGWNPTPSDATAISFMTLAGYMLGASVPRLSTGEGVWDAMAIGSAVGGLVAGVGGGLLIKPLRYSLSTGDALMIGLGTGFAAWQGIGWPAWVSMTNGFTDSRLVAVPFGVVGLTTVGLSVLSQFVDLDPMRAGWSFSGAAWGAWFGFLGSALAVASGNDLLLAMLVASDAGLALTAALLSPVIGLDPGVLVWSSLFGVGGAVIGTLGWVLFGAANPQHFAITNLVLTGLGLAGGALVGSWMPVTPVTANAPDEAWADARFLPIVAAAPVVSPDGSTGYSGTLTWILE